MNYWEKIKNTFEKTPTVEYDSLLRLEAFKWIDFEEGIKIRTLPNGLYDIISIECTMKKGSSTRRHDQDFFETFLILEGVVKDKVSGIVMKPDGRVHMWRRGTPHQPEALEDSRIMIFCKKSKSA